jgi:two-component system LytT family response regulator
MQARVNIYFQNPRTAVQKNKMIQAYIIDDERLARVEMRHALAAFSDRITVVGEAAGKEEAVEYLASPLSVRPDVIFLDINMPDGSGFDVLEEIDCAGEKSIETPIEKPIQVVFVTAYDEYAVRAFAVNALDYILKPVDPKRLEQTIMRVERVWQAAQEFTEAETLRKTLDMNGKEEDDQEGDEKAEDDQEEDATAEDELAQRAAPLKLTINDVIFITIGRYRRFVPLADVVCIAASDNYSELRLADGRRALLLRTMSEWEEMLPPQDFMRIHRKTIINLAYLDPARPVGQNGRVMRAFLKGIDEPFAMSRRGYAKWRGAEVGAK